MTCCQCVYYFIKWVKKSNQTKLYTLINCIVCFNQKNVPFILAQSIKDVHIRYINADASIIYARVADIRC